MKVFLTFDYELFFGEDPGTIEKCMLEPTNDLFRLAENMDVQYTFFVDVGFLVAADKYDQLNDEVSKVEGQIRDMIKRGHDVQLHIHPHWERAEYKDGKWEMNVKGAYRLHDFGPEERKAIIRKYKKRIEELIGRKVSVLRAGGWCIQPFSDLKGALKEEGVIADTSVIRGDFMLTDEYALDFREAPEKDEYRFEDDVCVEDPNGSFTEYPITSMRYSPLFFWRLYSLGRLFPGRHKMIGDGNFLSQGGRKKKVLKTYSYNHISTDGYFSSKLEQGLNMCENKGFQKMVVIGHPKGNTLFSIEKLQKFIDKNHKKHEFTSFHKELCK